MRLLSATQLAALAGVFLCGAAFANEAPDVTSAPFTYRIDTLASPRAIKTQADLDALWKATYLGGETVTATAPNGAASTLVASAVTDGFVTLPFTAGGLWTLENSAQGTALFTVRHTLFGTLGEGTSASPAKIVDTLELMDLVAAGIIGNDSVYTLCGVSELSPMVPPGYGKESAGDGLWRLVVGADGCASASEAFAYSLDTLQNGPDRTIYQKTGYVIAYSGDNWAGSASASSLLMVRSPRGDQPSLNLTGTGTTPFLPATRGEYTVTLTAGGITQTAVITINLPYGTMIILW